MIIREHSVQRARFVSPQAAEFRQYQSRMKSLRFSFADARDPGEMIGNTVERAARHWLSQQVTLDPNRILSWHERSGGYPLYREIDAVQRISNDEVCLYEIKLTTPSAMQGGLGMKQLNTAAQILTASRQWRTVRRRLLYVAEVPLPVRSGKTIPAVSPGDFSSEVGVIWISPQDVAVVCSDLGMRLPIDWLDPATRRASPKNDGATENQDFSIPFNSLGAALEQALTLKAASSSPF